MPTTYQRNPCQTLPYRDYMFQVNQSLLWIYRIPKWDIVGHCVEFVRKTDRGNLGWTTVGHLAE